MKTYLNTAPDPLTAANVVHYKVWTSQPYSIAHSRTLDALGHLLEQRQKTNHANLLVHEKMRAFIRFLNGREDAILYSLCENCSDEQEAFQLVDDIESIKQRRVLGPEVYWSLARLQGRSANLSKANAYTSQGLKIYPKFLPLIELQASLHSALGHKQEALDDVERLKQAGRGSNTLAKLRHNTNSLLAQLSSFMNEDEQAAKEVLEPALKEEQQRLVFAKNLHDRADALLAVAELEIAGKNYTGALNHIDESIKLNGTNPKAYELSSWCLEGLKRPVEAVEARRTALTLFQKR
jgi:tetratricopeptide (TPR) repeat protein